ncbi:MAG: hypothetical protein IRY94_13495, partial [Rhodospirillaceae bacterium]|nr:hypothetical protein [Rhodospirillaceae bacterium]
MTRIPKARRWLTAGLGAGMVALALSAGSPTPAAADDGHWRGRGWSHHRDDWRDRDAWRGWDRHRDRFRGWGGFFVPPPRIYYPPPGYVPPAPPPAYYYPP